MITLTTRRFSTTNPVWRLLLLACIALQGCAAVTPPVPAQEGAALAAFYWPYAALATDVYRTQGKVEEKILLAGSSPWLRREMAKVPADERAAALKRAGLDSAELLALYRQYVAERCGLHSSGTAGANADPAPDCLVPDPAQTTELSASDERPAGGNQSLEGTPLNEMNCDDSDDKEPLVPVAMAARTYGWERAPEFQRDALPKGWRIFVPELAVDVWRRPLPSQGGSPVVEYAIVYRGTVGSGGWLSNLRALTAFTPFIWDQYRQAEITTRQIVRQLRQVHALSDALFERQGSTKLHITAVGHSLGAGLANYIFLQVPDITRVVGFDPSPIDGASLISLDQRSRVMGARAQPVHLRDQDPSGAAIHLLFEKGEIISQVAPCHDGPIWGSEGGPIVRCESVDYSRGNILRQHRMPRLACMLFLATRSAVHEDALGPSQEARMADR